MVVRDAGLHKMVDNRDSRDGSARAVPDPNAVPAILFIPRRLPQTTGMHRSNTTMGIIDIGILSDI